MFWCVNSPEFVGGEIHAVEVGEHMASLHILGDQTELAERTLGVSVVLEIGQRHLEHAVLQAFGGDLGALGTVDQGLADLSVGEDIGGLDVVPVLAAERVDHLLLAAFLASLGESLVFADSHD